jgi:hypothetical protein
MLLHDVAFGYHAFVIGSSEREACPSYIEEARCVDECAVWQGCRSAAGTGVSLQIAVECLSRTVRL